MDHIMDRRTFLKNGALFAFALAVYPKTSGPAAANTTASGTTVYRGDAAGNIFVSQDTGKTWQIHTRFGPQYTIQAMFQDPAHNVYARLGFAGRSFDLVLSAKSKHWRSV